MPFRWLRRLIYLVVVVAFIYLVVTSIEVVTASRASGAPSAVTPADAIVVIGSATPPTGISADLKARCEQAAALFADHKARLVITTGGPARPGDPPEAAVADRCLRGHGVTDVKEVAGATVPAQLAAIGRLLPAGAQKTVILVADPLQTKWLRAVAVAEKLDPQVSPGPAARGSFVGRRRRHLEPVRRGGARPHRRLPAHRVDRRLTGNEHLGSDLPATTGGRRAAGSRRPVTIGGAHSGVV